MQTEQTMMSALAAICGRRLLPDLSCGATIEEPYVPYLPGMWNGVLVLAEAQNHGTRSAGYLFELRGGRHHLWGAGERRVYGTWRTSRHYG